MMTDPDELDVERQQLILELTDTLSDSLVDQVTAELIDELPSKLIDAVREGELEPLAPTDGIAEFTAKKRENVSDSTIQTYQSSLRYVETYLVEELELENLNNLTPRQANGFLRWRRNDSLDREEPTAPKSLRDDMYLFKHFIKHMISLRAIAPDVYDAIEIPRLNAGEGVDYETLRPERVADILGYLDRFQYASNEHAVWVLLAKTGRRPVDLYALDVRDFEDSGDESTLAFRHRPQTGTRLKSGRSHEAVITLTPQTSQVLRDYLDYTRPDEITDEHDREPLLATRYGRLAKATIRQYTYKWSRPCKIGNGCPKGRNEETCEGAGNMQTASKCPVSKSPKTVRSGYITSKSNAGASLASIGHRVGATPDVLKRYYDHPTPEEKRARHETDILTHNEAGSGYANTTKESADAN